MHPGPWQNTRVKVHMFFLADSLWLGNALAKSCVAQGVAALTSRLCQQLSHRGCSYVSTPCIGHFLRFRCQASLIVDPFNLSHSFPLTPLLLSLVDEENYPGAQLVETAGGTTMVKLTTTYTQTHHVPHSTPLSFPHSHSHF